MRPVRPAAALPVLAGLAVLAVLVTAALLLVLTASRDRPVRKKVGARGRDGRPPALPSARPAALRAARQPPRRADGCALPTLRGSSRLAVPGGRSVPTALWGSSVPFSLSLSPKSRAALQL